MKNLLLVLLCLPVMLLAQDEKEPSLFEVIRIEVKTGQEKAFEAAVQAHNAAFHGEGDHQARLYYNLNGPYGGEYSWIMGPTTWTAMDSRPGEGAHDDDWDKVGLLTESFSSPQYYSRDSKLSHTVINAANTKSMIWVYDIKSGHSARWGELIGKVQEVYEKKRPDESFSVVWNEFSDTKSGMDAAVIFSFDKWAWLDRESSFSKDYEEINGPASWHNFLNSFNDTIDGRVDWIRELVE